MSYAQIASALRSGAKTILERATISGGLGFTAAQIAWPNVEFTPPNTNPYVEVALLSNPSSVATLGRGGEDNQTGVLQLSLYYPLQTGDGALYQAYQLLSDFFTAGVSLAYEGQEVWIESSGMSPPSKKDSRFVTYVSIYWTARTNRPANAF
jgi:hypothetical protein